MEEAYNTHGGNKCIRSDGWKSSMETTRLVGVYRITIRTIGNIQFQQCWIFVSVAKELGNKWGAGVPHSVQRPGYGLDDRGSIPGRVNDGIFSIATTSRPDVLPNQPPIQRILGALTQGVKRPGREADHSFPSSSKVKNMWSYNSTPQQILMTRCLVKHRDNLKSTFY